jgi:pentatricopeptide repeat protein
MQQHKVEPDLPTYTALITAFKGKRELGEIKTVISVFEEMKSRGIEPDFLAYNAIIDCLGKAGDTDAMMKYWNEMTQSHTPTTITYATIMSAFARKGDVLNMMKFYSAMQESGQPQSLIVLNIMIDCFADKGDTDNMIKIFNTLSPPYLEPTVYTFNSVLKGFGKRGDINAMLAYYEKMKELNVKPDKYLLTYNKIDNLNRLTPSIILGALRNYGDREKVEYYKKEFLHLKT